MSSAAIHPGRKKLPQAGINARLARQQMDASGHQPAELLKMALSADATDWDRLHLLCHDRSTAEALGRMLEEPCASATDEARSWAQAIEEMHPGLQVNLPRATA